MQLSSFIRKDYFYAKLTGTTVATPGGGGIIPKKIAVMSGGSIPAIKVILRTIIRVNPTMTGFHPDLSVMLVVRACVVGGSRPSNIGGWRVKFVEKLYFHFKMLGLLMSGLSTIHSSQIVLTKC